MRKKPGRSKHIDVRGHARSSKGKGNSYVKRHKKVVKIGKDKPLNMPKLKKTFFELFASSELMDLYTAGMNQYNTMDVPIKQIKLMAKFVYKDFDYYMSKRMPLHGITYPQYEKMVIANFNKYKRTLWKFIDK